MKLTVTVRESYSYSTGILLLQYGNLTVTIQESYSYSTGSLQLQYSCCWFHPVSVHSSCSGLGSCTSGSSFATSTLLTSLYMQISTQCIRSMGDFVMMTSSRRVHTEKGSLRFTKYTGKLNRCSPKWLLGKKRPGSVLDTKLLLCNWTQIQFYL